MNSARQIAYAALLATAVMGCRHAKSPSPLVQTQAPSIKTQKPAAPPSEDPLSTQSQAPLPNLPPAAEDATSHAPPPPPPKSRHFHRKPAPAAAQTTAPPAAPAAAPSTQPAPAPALTARGNDPGSLPPTPDSQAPTASSPIGLLSTSDVTTNAESRRSAADLIASTDSGLNGLKRALNAQERLTAGQIRSFLQKAKAALEADDVAGAHTLATKAKVLLDELTKQ